MSDWIDVNDRLPTNTDMVLYFDCGNGDIDTAMYEDGKWYYAGDVLIDVVDYWQPLPEPPKWK